jgi:hypothetical protein
MGQIKIQNRSENLQPLLDEIYDFLILKAKINKRKSDYNNMSYFGTVGFWIHYDENTNQPFLCYTRHPKNWGDLELLISDFKQQRHKLEFSAIF